MLYVHYPPRVLHGMVCFENNTNISRFESCNYMNIVIINNNTAAYSYKMNEVERNKKLFKILFYYPNNTIFDTNWIERSMKKSLTSNCTQVSQVKNEQESKCLFSFILNVIMFVISFLLSTILGLMYYYYRE